MIFRGIIILEKLVRIETVYDIDENFTYASLGKLINVSDRTIRTYMKENQDLKDLYREYKEIMKDKKQIILFKRFKAKNSVIKSMAKLHSRYIEKYKKEFNHLLTLEKTRKYWKLFN